jgi:hypothetical protein
MAVCSILYLQYSVRSFFREYPFMIRTVCGFQGKSIPDTDQNQYSEKTCPSATMPTTNPTSPDPAMNPGHHGGKPATNRLSYGAVFTVSFSAIKAARF